VPTPRRWNCPVITTAMDAQFLQHGFDSHVAGRYLLAVGVIEGERLLERKQMLRAVAAGERPCDRLGEACWLPRGARSAVGMSKR
jgi:hypothetical protein